MSHYVTITMVNVKCCECQIMFSVTQDFELAYRKNHKYFYCPKGHQQFWDDKTDEEKLKESLKRSNLELKQAESSLEREKGYSKALEKSRSAVRGQVTKIKNRVAKGVCPCCNRHFENLHRHMTSQHPDYNEKK